MNTKAFVAAFVACIAVAQPLLAHAETFTLDGTLTYVTGGSITGTFVYNPTTDAVTSADINIAGANGFDGSYDAVTGSSATTLSLSEGNDHLYITFDNSLPADGGLDEIDQLASMATGKFGNLGLSSPVAGSVSAPVSNTPIPGTAWLLAVGLALIGLFGVGGKRSSVNAAA
jgi:expansin (peptidoglycan-binding protein)